MTPRGPRRAEGSVRALLALLVALACTGPWGTSAAATAATRATPEAPAEADRETENDPDANAEADSDAPPETDTEEEPDDRALAEARAHAADAAAKRAEDALADARRDPRYTFCSAPKRPLPPEARAFCAAARDLPDCAGLAAACDTPAPSPRLVEWLAHVVPFLLGLGKVAVWALLAAVVVLVLVPAALGLRRLLRRRRRDEAPSVPPSAGVSGESLPFAALQGHERLLAEADRLAATGELVRAGSTYLAAALAALEARGLLHREPQRTNGEYVRRAPLEVRGDLAAIAVEVDAAEYGGAAPSPARVRALGEAARRLARDAAASTLLVVALAVAPFGLGGCSAAGGDSVLGARARADDPAGPELALDVLTRLGHAPRPLPRALVHLEPPRRDGPPIVLVLDTRRVSLEDAVAERLVAFVRGGGVLLVAGAPSDVPPGFDARPKPAKRFARASVRADLPLGEADDGPWYDDALVQDAVALDLPGSVTVARSPEGHVAAAYRLVGDGAVLVVSGSEVFANAGLVRGRSAVGVAALVTLAERLAAGTPLGDLGQAPTVYVARPEDAFEPPSNPLAALVRAGLGLALLHAAFAVGALFLAKGARHAAPARRPPRKRTAFAEHVEATGAFYAQVRADRHALRAYARWLERDAAGPARGGRGRTGDAAELLAARAGRPVAEVRAALLHATTLAPAEKLDGDERRRLHELVQLAALPNAPKDDP